MSTEYQRALTLIEAGDATSAKVLLEEICASQPSHCDALNDLGVLLFQEGRNNEALLHLKAALYYNPTSEALLTNLAEIELQCGYLADARNSFERVLHVNDTNVAAIVQLGNIAKQLGDFDETTKRFRDAQKLDPSNQFIQNLIREADPDGPQPIVKKIAKLAGTPAPIPAPAPLPDPAPVVPAANVLEQAPQTPVQVDVAKLRRWEASIQDVTRKVSSQALNLLPPGGVLVDVGANVGVFTDQIIKERACIAYLFEPVPEYYTYCRNKFAGIPMVVVENFALAEANGQTSLWLGSENLGWNTIVGGKAEADMQEIKVPTVTFDYYASLIGLERIDVLKVDVEGGESRVLKGMRETLLRLPKKPFILMEIGAGQSGNSNSVEEIDMLEWLFANGYERLNYTVSGGTDVVLIPRA